MAQYLPILYAILALGGLGILFGLVLGVADKKFAVEVDERVSAVRAVVAGANCGACGYAGCDAYAEAVVRGEAKGNACTPGGAKTAKAISSIMGVDAEALEPMVARVRCQGTCENVTARYDYSFSWMSLAVMVIVIVGYFVMMIRLSDKEYREVIAEKFGEK